MNLEEPAVDLALEFDPAYQNNLFIIEDALQQTGALPPPVNTLPNIYDTQLRNLIESVSLES